MNWGLDIFMLVLFGCSLVVAALHGIDVYNEMRVGSIALLIISVANSGLVLCYLWIRIKLNYESKGSGT